MRFRAANLIGSTLFVLIILWLINIVIEYRQWHIVGDYYYSWHDGTGIIYGNPLHLPTNGIGPDVVWYELHGSDIIGETRDGPYNSNTGDEKYGYFIYDTLQHTANEGLNRPDFLRELHLREIPVPSEVR
jgi:hypothetical protein